jgi:hypothetical protein
MTVLDQVPSITIRPTLAAPSSDSRLARMMHRNRVPPEEGADAGRISVSPSLQRWPRIVPGL